MSRVQLTIKNAWIALCFQILYILIQFFSRDIFLNYLGDEFIGTVETLKSILQFLNLSELGIGTAVGFSLYKPLYNNDRAKINEIIGYLGFLYKRIGFFVLISAIILIFFFPYIFSDVNINLGVIIFLFSALLISNLISYFFAYYMFLLQADQKNYINITIGQSVFILRLALQCLVLIYLENVVYWIFLELMTPFIYIYILRKKIKNVYPWLVFNFKITKDIRSKNQILLTKIKQISFHKLGTFVTNSTDSIIIFSLVNPAMVAFVSNYQMVMNNLNLLISKLFEGTNAGVGNLVAEDNMYKNLKIFWEFMALRFFLAGCTSVVLYIGFEEFINLWLGEKYILSKEVLLALIMIFYMLQIRQPVDSFKQAYGLFGDTWAPILQSIINLLFSIFLVFKYGVIGVFIGTLISQFLVVLIWRPFYLFRYGFRIEITKYCKGFISHIVYFVSTILMFNVLISTTEIEKNYNYLTLFIRCLTYGVVFFLIYAIILFTFSQGFRDVLNRIYFIVTSRFSKK